MGEQCSEDSRIVNMIFGKFLKLRSRMTRLCFYERDVVVVMGVQPSQCHVLFELLKGQN